MKFLIFVLLSAILCSCSHNHQPEPKADTVYSVIEIHDTVYVTHVDTIYVKEKPKPKRKAMRTARQDRPKRRPLDQPCD